MTRSFHPAILIAGLTAMAGTARAQNVDYDALEKLFGEPVTTSVTGSPQRASDVPAAMEIITADQIRRSGARDIPGVLRHVAGVDVLQWTNDQADVAVRGYNEAFSPRLLVLVNGRQVYADYYGFTPWSTVPVELDDIRQIEVVKGPACALFGFNAVAGVVNIITYGPDVKKRMVSTSAGTQSLAEASLASTFELGDAGGLRLAVGTRQSDDFSTPVQPADLGTRRGDRRDAAAVTAEFAVGDKVRVGVEGTYSSVKQAEMPPSYVMSYTSYDRNSLRARVSADTRIGLLQANVYRNSIVADAFLLDQDVPFLRFDNDVSVAQVQDVFKVGAHHVLRATAEYRDNSMATTPVGGARVGYDVVSAGGMWSWTVNDALSWTTAVRVDDWSLYRHGYLPPELAAMGLSNASWERSLTPVSLNTGIVWKPNERSTVRVAGARGQQLPNLFDLGGAIFPIGGGRIFGNTPSLDFADVTTYEVDWERRLPSDLELRLAFYKGRTDDVLTSFANLDVSKTTGAELSVSGAAGEHWQWSASYTPQRIRDRFPVSLPLQATYVDFEDTTPRHVVNGHAGWSRGPWEVDGYLRYESRFEGLRGPSPGGSPATLVAIPSYVAVDARLGYAFSDRTSLALSGQNLTTARQRQTAGPEVERRLLATFTVGF